MAVNDRRLANGNDEGIAAVIRGLPRREPQAALRERALCGAAGSTRRTGALRPAMALAALAVLLVGDHLVGRWQERQIMRVFPTGAVVVYAQKQSNGDDLRDLGLDAGLLRVAGLRTSRVEGDTYSELRARLLRDGEGG